MDRVTRISPAKVNLLLRVVGKRADGYHLLNMVMVPLALHDTITVGLGAPPGNLQAPVEIDGVILSSPESTVPADARHLCIRAAQALRRFCAARGDARADVIWIELHKEIPVGAGLGGGSSNAATVLKALNTLWNLQLTPAQLAAIGVTLGADVPFFCYEGPAWVAGIGEQITPLKNFPQCHLTLVNPGFPVATAAVYRDFSSDFSLTPPISNASQMPPLGSLVDVVRVLENDLQRVVARQYPAIEAMLQALRNAGARGVLMSGSGSTVFGVFDSKAASEAAASAIATAHGYWTCATVAG